MTFGLKEFIILKRSFIGEKKISLPFSRIDKLVMTDGLRWNSLEINPSGFLNSSTTIYFRNDKTIKYIMVLIASHDMNSIAVQKESLLKRFDALLP